MTRRHFLRTASTGTATLAWLSTTSARAASRPAKGPQAEPVITSPNERVRVGCIGNGGMGRGDASNAKRYGDIIALCDVDRSHAETLNAKTAGGKAVIYEDYRLLLERNDIDVVTISTPDHWHTKIAVDAMRAGKDVYCQKPLTLTVEEGRLLCKVVKETGRVLQVGTQQRSEYKNMFQKAVALVQDGRIGKVKRVVCALGPATKGGPFPKVAPPPGLNWGFWLGQAPWADYRVERCHSKFRWWFEYSGGKITDWGAHHVDIAQWAIGMEHSGPISVEVVSCDLPYPLKRGLPTVDDCYNTPTDFAVRCGFAHGAEIWIKSQHEDEVMEGKNGILFEGESGKFFVSRQVMNGGPIEALEQKPLAEDLLTRLRNGKLSDSHMGNFIACVKDRSQPVSDVFTHHRTLTTCHLANIAIRLGRTLKWNPATEQIIGDRKANGFLSRPQRKGYEIV